jgi:hypothetical protein
MVTSTSYTPKGALFSTVNLNCNTPTTETSPENAAAAGTAPTVTVTGMRVLGNREAEVPEAGILSVGTLLTLGVAATLAAEPRRGRAGPDVDANRHATVGVAETRR